MGEEVGGRRQQRAATAKHKGGIAPNFTRVGGGVIINTAYFSDTTENWKTSTTITGVLTGSSGGGYRGGVREGYDSLAKNLSPSVVLGLTSGHRA